jgi:hypothetical protein
MNLFQVALAFYPNQKNPSRPSGRGIWRVISCGEVSVPLAAPRVQRLLPGRQILVMLVDRMLKPRSRVDPVRLALARLQATT